MLKYVHLTFCTLLILVETIHRWYHTLRESYVENEREPQQRVKETGYYQMVPIDLDLVMEILKRKHGKSNVRLY